MGGRGTFASGKSAVYTYETVGKINGVKVLKGLGRNHDLPQEAHSSKAYLALYRDGSFKQYREFNPDHTVAFDIDYHPEPKLTGSNKRVYHIHFYRKGVRDKLGRLLSTDEYEKYKKYFGGRKG